MTPKKTMASFESLCPRCNAFEFHVLLDSLPGVLDIPPRDVLKCAMCGQIFYRRNND